MHYRKYMIAIDVFGAFAVLFLVGYLFLPNDLRLSERADGLMGNISSEFIGIWISVRLIEWAIRKNDLNAKIRVRNVRSIRMLHNQFSHFLDTRFIGALRRLDFEIQWCKSKLPTRLKHLKKDEIEDVMSFFEALDDLRRQIPSIQNYVEGDKKVTEIINSAEFSDKMRRLIEAKEKAENNILAETDEDEGI